MSKKRLYILRHGNAEHYNFENDAERKLTAEGMNEARSTARQFLQHQEQVTHIYVSPYRRAQETAVEFLATCSEANTEFHPECQTLDIITPCGKPMDVALWLSQQDADSILLVTHQPFAAQLVDLLSDEPLPHDFAMRTGTLVALEGEFFATACCSLRWVIHSN